MRRQNDGDHRTGFTPLLSLLWKNLEAHSTVLLPVLLGSQSENSEISELLDSFKTVKAVRWSPSFGQNIWIYSFVLKVHASSTTPRPRFFHVFPKQAGVSLLSLNMHPQVSVSPKDGRVSTRYLIP